MGTTSLDELLHMARSTARNVISELSAADSALNLMMHDESVSLEIRGKLSLLIEQVRQAAVPAKQFIMLSREQNNTETVRIGELISDLAPLLRRLLPKTIDFQIEAGTDLWPIRAHVDTLEQALITLFIRARNAMPNEGQLLLKAKNADEMTCRSLTSLRLRGDHVLIEIIDSGFPIPADYLKRIFDPFVITKGPPNGLSLPRAYWAIRDMNGHIIVKSEIGKGTHVHVCMPRLLA
jgi:two-component system, cell cycle sensor histidine kinase and response regulator CckA